jgi:hypothetical protein
MNQPAPSPAFALTSDAEAMLARHPSARQLIDNATPVADKLRAVIDEALSGATDPVDEAMRASAAYFALCGAAHFLELSLTAGGPVPTEILDLRRFAEDTTAARFVEATGIPIAR